MKRFLPTFVLLGCMSCGCSPTVTEKPKSPGPPVVITSDILKPPQHSRKILTVRAEGVQIYRCEKNADGVHQWVHKGPEADLLSEQGTKVGKHYEGPTWELTDGSKMVAEVKATDPSSVKGAIPWLLLRVKSKERKGMLSLVSWVQRIDTEGGEAPPDKCDASGADREVRVKYKATYHFYVGG